MNIIFVCTGNTCRSPMAQAIMLDRVKKLNIDNINIESRGINCVEGDPLSENSKLALKSMNIDFEHLSKPITMDDIAWADMIICMTSRHAALLNNVVPSNKLSTFNDYTFKGDVVDPYGQPLDVYLKTAEQIKEGIEKILQIIG